jgi:hypothetical protein
MILAFICLNLAVAVVDSLGIFNVNVPYESPSNLALQFSIPDNWEKVIIPTTLSVGGIISLALGYGFGAWILLTLGVLNFFWRPAQIAIGGLSIFLGRVGVPSLFCEIANVFTGVIWVFFIVEYLGGRQIT